MIDSEAIQAQMADVLDDVLPSAANAWIVTLTGGAANAYGEIAGGSETLTAIFLRITGEDHTARISGAGDTSPKAFKFVAKSTAAIAEGDRVRCDGNDYLVEAVTVMAIGDDDTYVEGRLRRIHGD